MKTVSKTTCARALHNGEGMEENAPITGEVSEGFRQPGAPFEDFDIPATSSVPLSTKQDPRRIGFFDLPAELRLIIYAYASALPHNPILNPFRAVECRCHPWKILPLFTAHPSPLLPNLCKHSQHSIDTFQLLNALSCVSKQLAVEARPIWFGVWTHVIQDDENPVRYSNGQQDVDFPKLQRFLRRLGAEDRKSIRRICITGKGSVNAWHVPTKEQIEYALDGCDDLHKHLDVEIMFVDLWCYHHWTIVRCSTEESRLVVRDSEKMTHDLEQCEHKRCSLHYWDARRV